VTRNDVGAVGATEVDEAVAIGVGIGFMNDLDDSPLKNMCFSKTGDGGLAAPNTHAG
jgi:hypothetical protein